MGNDDILGLGRVLAVEIGRKMGVEGREKRRKRNRIDVGSGPQGLMLTI